jgi:hypothetical protein
MLLNGAKTEKSRTICGIVALLVICLVVYLPFVAMRPLLDEQFLLKWCSEAGRRVAPFSTFLGWRGFSEADMWGPATTISYKIGYLLAFGQTFFLRLQGIVLHAAAVLLLYVFSLRLFDRKLTAFIAAAFFAVYPLLPEAVEWLPARGSLLAGCLLIGSLAAFQMRSGRWLIVATVLFTMALLSSGSVWTMALLFAGYSVFEYWRRDPSAPKVDVVNDPATLIAPMVFFIIAAAYLAGTGLFWDVYQTNLVHLNLHSAADAFKNAFLPVNAAIYPRHSRHVMFLLAGLVPFTLAFAVIAFRHRQLLRTLVFLLYWLALAMVPVIGNFSLADKGEMAGFGGHLLYSAAMPVCCILALVVGSPRLLAWRPKPMLVLTCAGALFIGAFFLLHAWKLNSVYASRSRLLAKVQKSIKDLEAKTHAPYVMAYDFPQSLGVAPAYCAGNMLVFDSTTGLLACNHVPPGRLKDALRSGHYLNTVVRWNEDAVDLTPISLPAHTGPIHLDAAELVKRLEPPLALYKNAEVDSATKELKVGSNGTSGPTISFTADGFTPFNTDGVLIEARIDGKPPANSLPKIDLYWTTERALEFDRKQRHVNTTVVVNDQVYRNYFLSLRNTAWLTGAAAKSFTVGFPAGTQVFIRSIHTASIVGNAPSFNLVPETDPVAMRFFAPFFNFPVIAELGLARLKKQYTALAVSHDSSAVKNASGVSVEISMPDRVFPNPNGDEPSGVGDSTLGIIGAKGTYSIPINQFPEGGAYSLRAVAISDRQRPIGHFSDDIYCLISRPYRNAWSE